MTRFFEICFIMLVIISVALMTGYTIQGCTECEARGGVYVRSVFGYECLDR